ncbi:MAG TPA: hypothetical protein VLL73_02820, partial [Desulfurivibrionaceae bacterium]|nr:hypothetical protein [Desulfurivibrionaceae bacterium]
QPVPTGRNRASPHQPRRRVRPGLDAVLGPGPVLVFFTPFLPLAIVLLGVLVILAGFWTLWRIVASWFWFGMWQMWR